MTQSLMSVSEVARHESKPMDPPRSLRPRNNPMGIDPMDPSPLASTPWTPSSSQDPASAVQPRGSSADGWGHRTGRSPR